MASVDGAVVSCKPMASMTMLGTMWSQYDDEDPTVAEMTKPIAITRRPDETVRFVPITKATRGDSGAVIAAATANGSVCSPADSVS